MSLSWLGTSCDYTTPLSHQYYGGILPFLVFLLFLFPIVSVGFLFSSYLSPLLFFRHFFSSAFFWFTLLPFLLSSLFICRYSPCRDTRAPLRAPHGLRMCKRGAVSHAESRTVHIQCLHYPYPFWGKCVFCLLCVPLLSSFRPWRDCSLHARPMCRHICFASSQMGVRVMDNNDQERERGITILAKVGSLRWLHAVSSGESDLSSTDLCSTGLASTRTVVFGSLLVHS